MRSAVDGGQWRPKLMGHQRKEIILELLCLPQLRNVLHHDDGVGTSKHVFAERSSVGRDRYLRSIAALEQELLVVDALALQGAQAGALVHRERSTVGAQEGEIHSIARADVLR